MINLINFDSWEIYEGSSEGSGCSEKLWLKSSNGTLGLFKFPKTISTTEHVSEKMASTISDILEIPCAKIDIGIRDGRIGSMSYLINQCKYQNILEGVHFILAGFPRYNPDKLIDEASDARYSFQMIYQILALLSKVCTLDWKIPFLNMLIFDALIGNSDRHQNNWAILQTLSPSPENVFTYSFCPLYDNGSSLCCYIEEEKIDSYLGKDKMKFQSLINTKSRSIIRISLKGGSIPTHLNMVKFLNRHFHSEIQPIISKISIRLTPNIIHNVVYEYPDHVLSPKRKCLIEKFLNKKIELITQIWKGD